MAARHLAMQLSMRETEPPPAEIYQNKPRMVATTKIRAVFTTHDLIVRVTVLTALLAELAGQRIGGASYARRRHRRQWHPVQ
jgi:hypothetical protein